MIATGSVNRNVGDDLENASIEIAGWANAFSTGNGLEKEIAMSLSRPGRVFVNVKVNLGSCRDTTKAGGALPIEKAPWVEQ